MASVLIPLAQGCEELEAITIVDLLRRAEIKVTTAGLDDQVVVASRGTKIIPDALLEDVLDQAFDMIVLPGGLPGADYLNQDKRIHEILKRMNGDNKWLAAICAAPKVFADAGLLENKKATSYPGSLDGVNVPGLIYQTDPVVIDGNIITSRGPGTAMDFALSLIELLCGAAQRKAVEVPLQRSVQMPV